MRENKGFGLIEIIVAVGIFATVAVTGLTTILHSFSINRLGEEQTIAQNYASQGLEAVRSLRKQGWSNLVNGTYGLSSAGGSWVFSGSSDSLGKLTRTVTVSTGNRDISGNIAEVGTSDQDLKKVTSTVTWNFGPTRNNSVVLTEYLTNYAKAIMTAGDGILSYSTGTTAPSWRNYSNASDNFGTLMGMPVGANARNWATAVAANKTELIAGYTDNAGTLRIFCFDGNTWTSEWSAAVGGTGTTRRFDIAYENNSGKAMVVYSTNTGTTNELAYRTKTGGCGVGNWSAVTNLDPVRTSGIVHWVKLAEDRRSGQNTLAMIWADASSDLSTLMWNGTNWVNEPAAVTEASLEIVATPQDIEDFDVEFESLTGNVMIVWANSAGANGTNGVRYRRCTGGTASCTWGAVTTPPTFSDDATSLDLAANPASDQMVFASIGNAANDLQYGYWSGSTWTNVANADTSCNTPAAGTQKVAVGWLVSGVTTRSLIVYDDQGSGNVNWSVGNAGSFAIQTDWMPTVQMGNNQGTLKLVMDPKNPDRALLLVVDTLNELWVKRIVMSAVPAFTWTNTDGGAFITNTLPQNTGSPIGFNYWRN